MIYPVDNAIQRLNNQGLGETFHNFRLSLFIFLQRFERQQDQRTPTGDILKPHLLAGIVSKRPTVSLFVI